MTRYFRVDVSLCVTLLWRLVGIGLGDATVSFESFFGLASVGLEGDFESADIRLCGTMELVSNGPQLRDMARDARPTLNSSCFILFHSSSSIVSANWNTLFAGLLLFVPFPSSKSVGSLLSTTNERAEFRE